MTDRPAPTDTHDFFTLLERLPFVGTVTKEMSQLRALLLDRRAPRILALGAEGSGKTALVSALLGVAPPPLEPASAEAPSKEAAPSAEAPSEEAPSEEAPSEGAPSEKAGPDLASDAPGAPSDSATPSEAHDDAALPITHGSWTRVAARGRQLAWLELVALDDGWPRETRRLLENALEEHLPDLVVVVLRAERLDRDLGPTLASLGRLCDALAARAKDNASKRPRLLLVVTAADELCVPVEFATPPYPTDTLARIDATTARARAALEGSSVLAQGLKHAFQPGLELGRAIACACPREPSRRFQLTEVAEAMLQRLPDATKVEAVRALPVADASVRDVARKVVLHFASIAVVVGLMPIPFSDAVALFPTQALMVTSVAYVAGQPWDRRAALEWVGSLGVMGGSAVGLRWGAQQLLKLWPGGGTLIAASVAGVGTEALGLSAIAYFIDGPGRRGRQRPFALPA